MTDHDLKDVTIGVATPDDARVLQYLAQIDSAPLVTGRVLLAELDGVPYAAISLDTGAVVADPFRPTAEAVRMLRLRRYQLTRQGGRGPMPARLRRVLARHAH